MLLTPHYDILDWIQPDWVIDTKDKTFDRGSARQRPKIDLTIWKVDSHYWKYYKPHYYLDLPLPVAAEYFIGTVDGELACHMAVAPMFQSKMYRGTRLVTMPEWQGAGVGTRFLNFVAEYHKQGNGRCNKKYPLLFHTSHPQLAMALRRSGKWSQSSAGLYAEEGSRAASERNARKSVGLSTKKGTLGNYGGHFRAVQGFKYMGVKE